LIWDFTRDVLGGHEFWRHVHARPPHSTTTFTRRIYPNPSKSPPSAWPNQAAKFPWQPCPNPAPTWVTATRPAGGYEESTEWAGSREDTGGAKANRKGIKDNKPSPYQGNPISRT